MGGMRGLARSLRILRKNWKLTAIAIFSLSIAMVLGVVSLSVSNTSLLVTPAGVAPDRLVNIYSRAPGKTVDNISYPDYQYYRDNNHVFTDAAAVQEGINGVRASFTPRDKTSGGTVNVFNSTVSENYFSVLGLHPYLGRFFAAGDDYATTQHYQGSMFVIARTAGDPRLWIPQLAKAVENMGFEATLRPITFADTEDFSLLPTSILSSAAQSVSKPRRR